MTDKDPKDMTASELLRLADSHPCSLCHLVMAGDESCATTGCASWAYRLADKIDAELAEARKDAIRESKKPMWWFRSAIKRGEDWPEPRDGEKFRDYLHRCFLPRLRFEDGEPVQFGEEVELHYKSGGCDKGSFQEIKYNKGSVWILSFTGVDHAREYRYDSERDTIKRPAPEALGADGLHILEGETVYDIETGEAYVVRLPYAGTGKTFFKDGGYRDPAYLTHTPPDTQERIDGDITLSPIEYCADILKLPNFDVMNYSGFVEAMMRDLLRRQRELNARKGGEE